MSNSVSNELTVVKNLINEGKFEKTLQITKEIEQNQNLTHEVLLKAKVYRGLSHYLLGEFESALKIAEEVYLKSQGLMLLLLSLDTLFLKELVLRALGRREEFSKSLKLHEKKFISIPREDSLKYQEREAEFYLIKSLGYFMEGNINPIFDYSNKSLALFKIVDPQSYFIGANLMLIGFVYKIKGELKLALECYEKALSLIPEGENYSLMRRRALHYRGMAVVYFEKGDMDLSLEYCIADLKIQKKINSYQGMSIAYHNAIETLVFKKDLTQAQDYLRHFKRLSEKLNYKENKLLFNAVNALVLKSSPRIRDRVEAENIMKNILEESSNFEMTNMASIYLCDWYFEEIQLTNRKEVMDDIIPLIDHLLRNAKLQNSYSLLANAKLLQAKLALLQINITEARQLLSEAQNIADEHELQRLAGEISREHDHLLEELKIWESIKKSKVSISERLKLASVDDVIDRMQGRLAIEPLDAVEEQPFVLLILGEENILLLSYPFSEKWKQENNLLENFLSAFSTFRDEFLSQGLDRAKFGEETLLLQSIDSFLICYLYRGQTYSAKQKMNFFSEALLKESQIIDDFKTAVSNKRTIEVGENPHIEELIVKSFMSDPESFRTPFKAYTGDEPFVFASYAHADKLEVYPIIGYLNKKNIKIWYDEGIPISENWKKSIAVNLERCSTFLVFITPQIINSKYVKKEISYALKKQKPFFAVYLKDTKLPTELEFEMADIQAMMSYLMPKSEFYPKLKELLNNSLNN